MELTIDRRCLRRLFALLAFTNLIFIAGTLLFTRAYRKLPGDWEQAPAFLKHVGVQFNLATENVVATWYSSMLLLLVAVAAGLCLIEALQSATGRREQMLGYGWLVMCAVFLLLSLDEIGSIHERLGMLAALNFFGDQAGGWIRVLAIPIAAVALFILAFGGLVLYRQPRALVLLVIGLTFFLFNPFLEYLEMALLNRGLEAAEWVEHDILVAVEEGMELFGSLSFLAAMSLYLLARIDTSAGPGEGEVTFVVSRPYAPGILITVIAIWSLGMVAAVFVAPYLVAGDTGIPENWFPSAMAMLTGLLAFVLASRWARGTWGRRISVIAGLLCMLFSAYIGANLYVYLPYVRAEWPVGNLAVTVVAALATVIAGVAMARTSRSVAIGVVTVAAYAALGSTFLWDMYTPGWVLTGCAVLALALGAELAVRTRNQMGAPRHRRPPEFDI